MKTEPNYYSFHTDHSSADFKTKTMSLFNFIYFHAVISNRLYLHTHRRRALRAVVVATTRVRGNAYRPPTPPRRPDLALPSLRTK